MSTANQPKAPTPIPVIGLTGGIASGKSTVAEIFKKKGIPVLDADKVARSLSEPGGKAADYILNRFGTLNRTELRRMIIEDPQAKKDLEAILHPLIKQESQRAFAEMALQNPKALALIYEAALLVEAGRAKDFTELLVVTAPHTARVSRLMARDHCSEEFAEGMIRAQMDDETRKKHATTVIENSGDLNHLEQQVNLILAGWRNRFSHLA